jgi:hypothetical protein
MNSTIYITGCIVIALILIGIVAFWISGKKKKNEYKKLIRDFETFAIKKKLTIDRKQVVHKNIIGIDRLNSKLIFLDKSITPARFHLINLNDLSACHLIKQKNTSTGHISRIILKCIFKKGTHPPIELLFYDEIKNKLSKMMRLSKKASYWQKSIHIFRETARLSAQKS